MKPSATPSVLPRVRPDCLGVDLVEMEKAKVFYSRHAEALPSFFNRGEMNYILGGKRPHERLAMLLAAKEAVFKAVGGNWMGPEGFRRIRIGVATHGRLRCRLRGFGPSLSLSYLKNEKYVVVRCAGIS